MRAAPVGGLGKAGRIECAVEKPKTAPTLILPASQGREPETAAEIWDIAKRFLIPSSAKRGRVRVGVSRRLNL